MDGSIRPEYSISRRVSAMSASIHDKLNRVRKPRVHITYDVETEGAQIQRELPFVVGIMGDFSGDPTTPLKPLADRKFTQIDRDNFNDVMASMAPGLKLKVVKQVPALAALLETREKLRDLMSKADRSQELENLLEQVLKSEQDLKSLSGELGIK